MAGNSTTFFGDLRPSQIITTFGPGAVIDLQTASLILAGTDYWSTHEDRRIDEPRLTALMRVRHLYRPPARSEDRRSVPAFVFPTYLVCPRCNRLAAYDRFELRGRQFRCLNSAEHPDSYKGKLHPAVFPARFVVACPAGHLDDFPWDSYVHGNDSGSCDPLALRFYELNQSGAIGDLYVGCRDCGKSESMSAAFDDRSTNLLGQCRGGRPWLASAEGDCVEAPRTVLRGASNLYFPLIQSALSIPEWDDPVQAAIASREEDLEMAKSLADVEEGHRFWAALRPFSPEEIWQALEARRKAQAQPPSPQDLRYEEFRALGQPTDPAVGAEREFQTEFVETPKDFTTYLDKVVVVRRLREVRALDSFTRIDAPPDLLLEDDEAQQRVQHQPIGGPGEDWWRPAVELLGEGIFLALKEDLVEAWEKRPQVQAQQRSLENAYREWRRARDLPDAAFPGSRFILLHSLAHLLITGLALDCGYSSTSIRERVYSSTDPDRPMAGILLYTATPDSDGSLGGLADQGQPERLGNLITSSLDRASYCSSDPLCGHAKPGEMGETNGAACHACLLVSETSCERSNHFLDRAHVVRTVNQLDIEFFNRP